MAKLFLLFSHKLTAEQIEDARNMGIEEFVSFPPELQERFSNIPPDMEDLSQYTKLFIAFLLENSQREEFGLVYKLVEVSKAIGLIPIYATTKRNVIER